MSMTLPDKIDRLGADADLIHQWAHGDAETSIELGGTPTPSPRKMMHDLDARESSAAQAAIAEGVAAAEASATAAANSAQIVSHGASVVEANSTAITLLRPI